jgi:hypothetical protein
MQRHQRTETKEIDLDYTPQQRKPTYLELDAKTKEGLRVIARYRHSTLAYCIEEAARMFIHQESNRIKEDLSDLRSIKTLMVS